MWVGLTGAAFWVHADRMQWVSDIIHSLSKVFPKLGHCMVTENHIKFVRGRAKLVVPGMYWYWPLTTQINKVSINLCTLAMQSQCVIHEGKTYSVNVSINYKVSNPLRLYVDNQKFLKTFTEQSQGAISGFFRGTCPDSTELDLQPLHEAIDRVNDSIDVVSIQLVESSKVIPVKLFKEWSAA